MTDKRLRMMAALLLIATFGGLAGCPPVEPPDPDPDPVGWSRLFGSGGGDDEAYAIEQTADGGFVVAGLLEPEHEETDDILLLKIDADGQEIWRETYGDERDDAAADVEQTADGGYIIAGRFGGVDADDSDAFLLKTDANGVEEWRAVVDSGGADHALTVDERPNGGYFAAVQLDSLGTSEAAIVAFDGQGTEQWRVSAGSGTIAAEAETLDDGSVVFAFWSLLPFTKQFELRTHVELLKLDGNGVEQWRTLLPSEVAVQLRAMDKTPDGGFILCGQSDFLDPNSHIFLWKTDSAGHLEWTREHGGEGRETAHKVRTAGSGYIVAGETSAPGEHAHALLLRTDGEGELLWERSFGGEDADIFHDVTTVSDGFVATGHTESFSDDDLAAHREIHIVRTDLNGVTPSSAGMVE